MKKLFKPILLVSVLLQASCSLRGFQPPPEEYEQWKRPNTSVHIQEAMASLMECGYPWPSTKWFDYRKYWGETYAASIVLAERCMESQGYVNELGSRYSCEQGLATQSRKYRTSEQIKALEHACDPNTPAPKPSVEKRLNSPYCRVKEYSKYPQCQPVVVPSSQTEGKISRPVVVPYYPPVDRVTPQVQKDSNAQMNQLLEGTNDRK